MRLDTNVHERHRAAAWIRRSWLHACTPAYLPPQLYSPRMDLTDVAWTQASLNASHMKTPFQDCLEGMMHAGRNA